jgi:hypothetical protein
LKRYLAPVLALLASAWFVAPAAAVQRVVLVEEFGWVT